MLLFSSWWLCCDGAVREVCLSSFKLTMRLVNMPAVFYARLQPPPEGWDSARQKPDSAFTRSKIQIKIQIKIED